MSDTAATFEQAQAAVKTLTNRPSDQDMLDLYALYKQGSAGDVTGKRPGMMDFVGRAKYDAWAGKEGMSQEDAMQAYIEKVRSLGADV